MKRIILIVTTLVFLVMPSKVFAQAPANSWANYCTSSSDYLSCKIVTDSTPTADTNINFSEFSSASNGRGLYYTTDPTMTEDLDGDGSGDVVYYYRGNVTNNYVKFDSYCWRIVRTTEDGNIRLIYGGTPNNQGNCPQNGTTASIGNSAFNSYTNYDNTYMGYMYGRRGQRTYDATHANNTNSTIKTTIDNWFRNNLNDSVSFLADFPYCNDRTLYSGNGYGTNASEYAPQHRFYGNENNNDPQTPTLVCNQDNDKFTVDSSNGNGDLTYPIALLTADEASLAGASYGTSGSNTDTYLYTGANYWLMSPGDIYNRATYVYEIANSGLMRLYTANQSVGTRPVITLRSDVTISEGTGTYNDPYVIATIEEINKYTVTYNDGVDNEVVFADQVYRDVPEGTTTPTFVGTPTRDGYTFLGWNPTVASTVTADITYVATWELNPTYADLEINKQVTGNMADIDELFELQITVTDNGVGINGSFDYYVGSTLQQNQLTFTNGVATTNISSVNNITIKDLEVGFDYSIVENTNGYSTTADTITGTINNTSNVVTFINNKEQAPATGQERDMRFAYSFIIIGPAAIILFKKSKMK